MVGWLNTEVSNQVVPAPMPPRLVNLPLILATCVLLGAFRMVALAVTENGVPDSMDITPVVCQPPAIRLAKPWFAHFLPLPKGNW